MYRIELTPGEVTVFRTIEELATGVRNGLITPKARIYHNASDKWLPIEFHPHYKQALEINSGHASDAGGHKHAAPGSKSASSKQASKSGAKPSKTGFTFLNVPISPVTPTPKPKSKSRVADLPYIQDGDGPDPESAARPSQGHEPSLQEYLHDKFGRSAGREHGIEPSLKWQDAIAEFFNTTRTVQPPVVTKYLYSTTSDERWTPCQCSALFFDPTDRPCHRERNAARQRRPSVLAHDLEDAHLRRIHAANHVLAPAQRT